MDPALGAGIGIAAMTISLIIGGVFYVYGAYTLMKIAQKLDANNAWFAWLPILNIVLMLKLADKPVWWILLLLVPFVNVLLVIIGTIVVWMEIAKKLNQPAWLGVLMFISPINLILVGYFAFSNNAMPASTSKSAPTKKIPDTDINTDVK